MGVPDTDPGPAPVCLHLGFYKYPAGDGGHFRFDPFAGHHLSCCDFRFRCHVLQHFQTFPVIAAEGAQGCGEQDAGVAGARNAAGKGVFVHAAVESDGDVEDVPRNQGVRPGAGEGDGPGLCDAQCRFHVIQNDFRQFVHRVRYLLSVFCGGEGGRLLRLFFVHPRSFSQYNRFHLRRDMVYNRFNLRKTGKARGR